MEAAQNACKTLPARTAEAEPLAAGKGRTRRSGAEVRQVHARTRDQSRTPRRSEGRHRDPDPRQARRRRPEPRKPRVPDRAASLPGAAPVQGQAARRPAGPPSYGLARQRVGQPAAALSRPAAEPWSSPSAHDGAPGAGCAAGALGGALAVAAAVARRCCSPPRLAAPHHGRRHRRAAPATRPRPSPGARSSESSTVDGTLGYGATLELYDRLAGTFTWLPAVGAVIGRGGTLWRVNNTPVVLMYGSVPAYRTLKQGVSDGPDVTELNENLIDLGFDPYGAITDDESLRRSDRRRRAPLAEGRGAGTRPAKSNSAGSSSPPARGASPP